MNDTTPRPDHAAASNRRANTRGDFDGDVLISAPRGGRPRRFSRGSTPPPLPEFEVETAVDDTSSSNFYRGFAGDIGTGGLFVATILLVHTGAHVEVTFSLPDGQDDITATGVVRWVRETGRPSAPAGYGVEFIDLAPDAEQRIAEFVRRRKPLPRP